MQMRTILNALTRRGVTAARRDHLPSPARPCQLEILEQRRLYNGTPVVSIGDVSLAEGDVGTTTAAMVVRLSQRRPGQAVTVNYATANGTAVAGADYVATSGKVTFAPGETSKTIQLPVLGDHTAEADEFFVVNIQGAKNAKIGDGQGIVTVADDEPRIAIAGVTADEGNTGATAFAFVASLSRAYDQAVTVNYATQDDTAVAGADYQAASGTVTFAAGETSKTIFISVLGDRLPEEDKYFLVNVSGASANAGISAGQGFATILDDEPRISIAGVGDTEGNSDTKDLVFTVNLSRTYDQDVTVSYATQDNSAIAGTDYLTAFGMLTFTPGDTTKTIKVQVIGNSVAEPDKYFFVNLSGASAIASVSYPSATGVIYDDDGYYDNYYYDYGYSDPWSYDPGYYWY